MKGLMWKLLRANISAAQLTGFALANLVGLTIVILAVQFYGDVSKIFDDDESFIKRDYLVITRKVTSMGSLLGRDASQFDAAAVSDLQAQPWVRKVGSFVSSDYSVDASIAIGNSGRQMRTQLFFEAIPDEFLDVEVGSWHFSEIRPEVPVIVSKDYLSLYNFGFAAAQGMPKVSEGMMSMIPLQFTITGSGGQVTLPGRIVGFSNRLNTILVPEEFMAWSNSRYGTGRPAAPSRLIVEVNAPGDERISQYMDSHGYEIAGDKMNNSRAAHFLTVLVSIVIAVGAIISVLSFFVLMLSIFLLLQKNARKLQDLLMLGYTPAQVSAPYIRLVLVIGAAVLVLAVALMAAARLCYLPMLQGFGITGSPMLTSILTAVAIMAVITAGNIVAIRRKVAALWACRN